MSQVRDIVISYSTNDILSECLFHDYNMFFLSEKEELQFLSLKAAESQIKSRLTFGMLKAIRQSHILGKGDRSWVESYAFRYILSLPCVCLRLYPLQDAINSLVHIWINLGYDMVIQECLFITTVVKYYIIERVMPTHGQFILFFHNHLDNESDDFIVERQDVPTPGISNIVPFRISDSNSRCSICISDIETNSLVVKLPQCGHVFHAQADECLGKASILTWLEKSQYCPNCKGRISIPKPIPKQNSTNGE
jgi:hypothetical protein